MNQNIIMKYHRLYSILILILFNMSCGKDFLNVDDNTQFYRQQYITDLKTMQDFLNGIYLKHAVNIGRGPMQAYPELIADNLKPASNAGGYLITQYAWAQQADMGDQQEFVGVDPDGTAMNPLWLIGYQIIRNCSFVIEEVDKYRSEDPLMANNLKGQAYALRALVHFKLVNVFSQSYNFTNDGSHPGIPYIVVSDVSVPFSRRTVAEVYNAIVDDYLHAIELLPAEIGDVRYINKIAAKGLLARAYLFKSDYINAKALSVDIASQIPLMSIGTGYPNGLFKHNNPSQTETLFQLSPNSGSSPLTSSNFLGALLNGVEYGFKATRDIADLLKEDPSDVRSNWVNSDNGQWFVTKFPPLSAPEVNPAISNPAGAYYPVEIRSSEMFLTAAEASAKLGDEENARVYLNAIRKRANPSSTVLTTTGNALIDSIYKERRKELAFEGLRMYDLQRWKKSVYRTDFVFAYAQELPYPNNRAIAPIPLRDVTLSGILQNIGY